MIQFYEFPVYQIINDNALYGQAVIPITGNITSIRGYYGDQLPTASGDTVIDILTWMPGTSSPTSVFSVSDDKLVIANGQYVGERVSSGLVLTPVPVTVGQSIGFKVVTRPSGGTGNRLIIVIGIDDGVGGSLPAGGTVGQALVKQSSSDGDVAWASNGSSISGDVSGALGASTVIKVQNIPVKSYSAGFLADDFNSASLNPMWEFVAPGSSVTVTQTTGHIEVNADAHNSANGLQLIGYKNFTNKFFTLEVIQLPIPSIGTYIGLIDETNNRYLFFELKNNTISGYVYYAGEGFSTPGVTAYVNATHRFLRLEHNSVSGKITWSTSPNGIAWYFLADYAIGPFTINNCLVRIIQVNGSGSNTQVAIIDNFNSNFPTPPTTVPDGAVMTYKASTSRLELVAPPSGGAAIAGDVTGQLTASNVRALQGVEVKDYRGGYLTDDFNNNFIDELWVKTNPTSPVTLVEVSGHIETTPAPDGTNSNNQLRLANLTDFTDKFFSIELVQPSVSATKVISGLANAGNNKYFTFQISGGNIWANIYFDGEFSVTPVTTAYSNVSHRFLRIEHNTTAGKIYWKTSPDGVAWTAFAEYAVGSFGINSCYVVPIQFFSNSSNSGVPAIFDNFVSNIPKTAVTIPDGAIMKYNATTHQLELIATAGRSAGVAVTGDLYLQTLFVVPDSGLLRGGESLTFRVLKAVHIMEIRASCKVTSFSGDIVVILNQKGARCLDSPLQIDAGKTTSVDSVNPYAFISSDGLDFAEDDEILISVDQAGNGAYGLTFSFIGTFI